MAPQRVQYFKHSHDAGDPYSLRYTASPYTPGVTKVPPQQPRESRHQQVFWRDPALPFVESRRACHSRACYRPHSHPSFSIGAVDAGSSLFSGAGDRPIALRPGTLVFVPATRVHACNPAPDASWSYQMLHLDAAWLQDIRVEYATDTTNEPIRIVDSPTLYRRFCQLNALLFSHAASGEKEAALIEFIGDHDSASMPGIALPQAPTRLVERLQPAMRRLQAAPADGIALAELAALSGMSRYQLIRAFRNSTGMTPHAWQLNQRINLARQRMRAGDAIASVAHELGFADQAHFQRVFKAHTGVTPGHYRS